MLLITVYWFEMWKCAANWGNIIDSGGRNFLTTKFALLPDSNAGHGHAGQSINITGFFVLC
jgi:hypothetical protein